MWVDSKITFKALQDTYWALLGQEDREKATPDRLTFISSGVHFLGQAGERSRWENMKKNPSLLYLMIS